MPHLKSHIKIMSRSSQRSRAPLCMAVKNGNTSYCLNIQVKTPDGKVIAKINDFAGRIRQQLCHLGRHNTMTLFFERNKTTKYTNRQALVKQEHSQC